ncbi:uncharacterized protein LOC131537579 [Onychostoma macrolepis]|uniref:uncharacterized protein LOC131537579 n=1 Tax=Onychostoma macrolepis TaxID=369639 RepID=UPI00272C78B5|nr:uncharacterized protein LOC131537579 [Onychostoma macrolepis]
MALAVVAKKQARQPTASENGASSTAHNSPEANAKRVTSFLNILGSDSSPSDEEEDEEQQLNQAVQREILMYFGEHPLVQKGESTVMVENECCALSNTVKAGKDCAVYSGHIHAIRASVFSSRKHCFKAQGKPQF